MARHRATDIHRIDVHVSPDRRVLWVRPIAPADAGPIDAAFPLLNEDEVRQRFLHPVRALTQEHIRRLTHPLPDTEFVVVAAEPYPPGEALIGAVARLSREPGSDRAEFGILVSHFVAGRGLGQHLMKRLIEFCRAKRIRVLWGDVDDGNDAMLRLADKLGFKRSTRREEPGIVRIELMLS